MRDLLFENAHAFPETSCRRLTSTYTPTVESAIASLVGCVTQLLTHPHYQTLSAKKLDLFEFPPLGHAGY